MWKDKIKISVLMCVYNTKVEYLVEAIESILRQTYSDFEFVIVDDGSTDIDTIQCLHRFKEQDNRIILVTNGPNIGLTKSLNIGLKYCKGKYIARMDSDDISCDTRFEKQLCYMENNVKVCLVGANICVFEKDINKGTNTHNAIDYNQKHEIRSLFEHSGPPHPTFFIRNDFLQSNKIEYREDILKAQDYGLMVDIYLNHGIINKMEEVLLYYRIHEGQITNTSFNEQKKYQEILSRELLCERFPVLDDKSIILLSSLTTYNIYGNIFEYRKAIRKLLEINDISRVFEPNDFECIVKSMWEKKKKKVRLF